MVSSTGRFPIYVTVKTIYFQAQIMVSVQAFLSFLPRALKFPLPLPFLTPATQVIHSRKLSSTRRWAIDSDGVARLVEISSVVKVVLLAMYFLVFAFCLVGCSSTWALRRFSAEPKWYLLLCYTLLWFKRHCLGILQSVDLLWCNSCTFWAVSWISVIDLDW